MRRRQNEARIMFGRASCSSAHLPLTLMQRAAGRAGRRAATVRRSQYVRVGTSPEGRTHGPRRKPSTG